jgi:glycosyltransferase involved in cell wall biosynthesis
MWDFVTEIDTAPEAPAATAWLPGTLVRRAPRVAVCVATYRRPGLLRALLESLAAQRFRHRAADVLVVVVDNDAGESARAVVDAADAWFPFPLEYAVEPERNISLARNRAVGRALARRADFLAFVDDDETAHADWLDQLLDAQARFGADAVQGSVLPRFTAPPPRWAVRGGFFVQTAPAAGTVLPVASTNNVLASASLFAGAQAFDPRFGLGAGEDSLFFMRAARNGARIVAAPAAVTDEHVGPERSRAPYVLRRAFRHGNTAVFCERALPSAQRRVASRLLKSALRVVAAAAVLPFSVVRGRAGVVSALSLVCMGAGSWVALTGHRVQEYRRLAR